MFFIKYLIFKYHSLTFWIIPKIETFSGERIVEFYTNKKKMCLKMWLKVPFRIENNNKLEHGNDLFWSL